MSAGLVAYEEIKTFIEDGWIEEVLFPLKSGKEANVYCCLACPGRGHAFFALKVYKSKKLAVSAIRPFIRRGAS
jgi:serine/threonine-protein kinase RIO1